MPGEKDLGARTRTNNNLNPHMTLSPGIEPGHNGGRRALSPLRHTCSLVSLNSQSLVRLSKARVNGKVFMTLTLKVRSLHRLPYMAVNV